MIVRYHGGQKFTAETRGHVITTDLPADRGGGDTSMTPTELFVASLGACIGVYVTSYLERAGVSTEGMTVAMTYERVEEPVPRIGHLKAVIHVPGGIPEQRRNATLKVAHHCLIHNTLSNTPDVEIEVA